jgi:thiamine-phosphate pyrophosphorylase
MKFDLSKPILYLITRGETTEVTTADSPESKQIIEQVSAAVSAGIDLIQLREKRLSARELFELTRRVVAATRGSATRVLVNDRADIAVGAGADGVHLTTQSVDAATIRRVFGDRLLIGVSTHALKEARTAQQSGADFVVFGPVFHTQSKREFGAPVGIAELASVTHALIDFPVLALGGVTLDNVAQCLQAGARGIAGISLFAQLGHLQNIAAEVRKVHRNEN